MAFLIIPASIFCGVMSFISGWMFRGWHDDIKWLRQESNEHMEDVGQ